MENKEVVVYWYSDKMSRLYTLNISGNYHPGESSVPYYKDGDGYPGSPDFFEIETIILEKSFCDGIILSHRDITKICEKNDSMISTLQEKALDYIRG